MIFTASFVEAIPITRAYDAGLGTLPDSQGWTVFDTDPSNPAYTLVGGALHQGPTTIPKYQFWERSDLALDFAGGVSLEWDMKIISSDLRFSPLQRAGFGVGVVDGTGSLFAIWMGEDRIFIHTDASNNSGTGMSNFFDTTDAFHNYRFDIAGGMGSLFIDGSITPFLQLAVSSAVRPDVPNRVSFGDGTVFGTNESLLTNLSYTADAFSGSPVSVPEPSAIILLGSGLIGLVRASYKRNKKDT